MAHSCQSTANIYLVVVRLGIGIDRSAYNLITQSMEWEEETSLIQPTNKPKAQKLKKGDSVSIQH